MPAKTAKSNPIDADQGPQASKAHAVARETVSATPVAPTFPTLDRLSNDNASAGLSTMVQAPVSFEGSASHYRLPVFAALAAIVAFVWFAYEQGLANFVARPEVQNWAVVGLAAIAVLFLFAAMRRRTVGIWATGDEIRLSKGLPSFRLHQLKLKDLDDIAVTTSRFGSSGSVAVRTLAGKKVVVRNIAHAHDASAYLPLLLAASRVQAASASQRALERQARVAATTPYVVALPPRREQAS